MINNLNFSHFRLTILRQKVCWDSYTFDAAGHLLVKLPSFISLIMSTSYSTKCSDLTKSQIDISFFYYPGPEAVVLLCRLKLTLKASSTTPYRCQGKHLWWHAFNPALNWGAEEGGSLWVRGHPTPHREFQDSLGH